MRIRKRSYDRRLYNHRIENNIKLRIMKEGLEVLVVSYGGSCCNLLVSLLQKNNIKSTCPIWHQIACHCPEYVNVNIPTIYVYDNPVRSFLSMKRRGTGIWDVNQQKLSNNNHISLSDEQLLSLMIKQFKSWSAHSHKNNLLFLKSEELFQSHVTSKINLLLKKKCMGFPAQYIPPKTDVNHVTESQQLLFQKYAKDIDYINNFNRV